MQFAIFPAILIGLIGVQVLANAPPIPSGFFRSTDSHESSLFLDQRSPDERPHVAEGIPSAPTSHQQQERPIAPHHPVGPVALPSQPVIPKYKMVCYYESWSALRPGYGAFKPSDIDPLLCTHLVYAYAGLDDVTYTVKSLDDHLDVHLGGFKNVTDLRQLNPNLKVLLGVGGWAEGGFKFSFMARHPQIRTKFIDSLVHFLQEHHFDGADIEWMYPGATSRNGRCEDKENFVKLVKELKLAFSRHGLLLSAGLSPLKGVVDLGYDVPELSRDLDLMIILGQDLRKNNDKVVDHHSPLYRRPRDEWENILLNVDFGVSYFLTKGADASKLILGVPFYGRSYVLLDAANHTAGSAARGQGPPGPYTNEEGLLAYYEVCPGLQDGSWTIEKDEYGKTVSAHKDVHWVAYEDEWSIENKMNYIKSKNLGGAMLWAIDLDDFRGVCGQRWPLMQKVYSLLCGEDDDQEEIIIGGGHSLTDPDVEMISDDPHSLSRYQQHFSHPGNLYHLPVPVREVYEPLYMAIKLPFAPIHRQPAMPLKLDLSLPDTVCQKDGYHRDPTDCGRFYHCNGGLLRQFRCPANLRFNDVTVSCDWSHYSECDVGEGQTYSGPGAKTPFICPSNGLHPDPDDCRRYYICANDKAVPIQCPAGTSFQKDSRICNWNRNVNCPPKLKPDEFTTTTTTTRRPFWGEWSTPPTATTTQINPWWHHHSSKKPLVPTVKPIRPVFSTTTVATTTRRLPEILTTRRSWWEAPTTTTTIRSWWEPPTTTTTTTRPWWGAPSTTAKPWWEAPSTTTKSWWEAPTTTTTRTRTTTTTTSRPAVTWAPPVTWDPPHHHWGTTVSTRTSTESTFAMPQGMNDRFKVVCYFTNWAWYRPGIGKYLPEDIHPALCTHIIYAFTVLDSENLIIKLHDPWADVDNHFLQRVVNIKKKNPQVKVILGLGGWTDSMGDKYSRLVNNPAARAKFISHALHFINSNGFDGLDFDWEYPKCWQVDCKRGPESDKPAFAAMISELRAAFDSNSPRLLLTAAVSPSKKVIDAGYDVASIARDLDFINVMTYDYHGSWEKQTGHVAPLYYFPGDTFDYFNANYTLHYFMEKGAPRSKLIMGMPFYGQTWALADPSASGLNASTYGPGEAGQYSRQGGMMSYYEICSRLAGDGWTVVRDPMGRIGPFAFSGNQWMSYDDIETIRRKSEYVKQNQFGGAMIWALDFDDFKNSCCKESYPLLKTINRVLRNFPGSISSTIDMCSYSGPVDLEEQQAYEGPKICITSRCLS